MRISTKIGFSHNFLHPKWFNHDLELSKINVAKRTELNNFLSTFLEIGKFIQINDELKKWIRKMNVRRDQIPMRDMTEIDSWPLLVATLVVLAEKAS